MAEKKVISDLESLVGRLIADHRRMTELCNGLVAERDALRGENRDLQERVRTLERDLARNELSRGLRGNAKDQTRAIARVNRLMREVDKCVALLDNPERIG